MFRQNLLCSVCAHCHESDSKLPCRFCPALSIAFLSFSPPPRTRIETDGVVAVSSLRPDTSPRWIPLFHGAGEPYMSQIAANNFAVEQPLTPVRPILHNYPNPDSVIVLHIPGLREWQLPSYTILQVHRSRVIEVAEYSKTADRVLSLLLVSPINVSSTRK